MKKMTITRLAPAKINLMLHVVERLNDGYHHLQSLIAFANTGDQISIEKADQSSLTVDGPFADQITFGPHNSIIQAAQFMGKKYPDIGQIHIHLTKNLPIASGIGGGSSDAAATIAALLDYHKVILSTTQEDTLILESSTLGADLPVCLARQFARGPFFWIDGSEREVLPIPIHQKLSGVILLVNPGVALPTHDVFEKIRPPYTSPQDFEIVLDHAFQGNLLKYLKSQANDLTPAAIAREPIVENVLETLQATPDCHLARMSGSGATCFGIFGDEDSAQQAKALFEAKYPEGWSIICQLFPEAPTPVKTIFT
jgi:4-diphosphocytidyl-2-C-methyl-D-erythritol kinase